MFDIYPNRVETVKFVNAQHKLCDYMATRYPDDSKIFSHGVVVSHDIPDDLEFQRGEDPNIFLHDQYLLKMLMKRAFAGSTAPSPFRIHSEACQSMKNTALRKMCMYCGQTSIGCVH